MSKKVNVESHWREELTKLRCWLSGFKEGRQSPGSLICSVPGEDVLRQIIIAIDDVTKDSKNGK